jgi:transcriptional regulator of acetoin/glycerol metabolism
MNRLSDPGLDSLFSSAAQASTLRMPAVEDQTAMIERSHKRSAAYGLQAHAEPDFSGSTRTNFSLLLEQNHTLCTYALPVMESVHEQIINTHMVVLTDANGLVLHSLGDDDFLEKAGRLAMKPGVTWSEQSMGTNAIGTAIAEGRPTLVQAGEHYLRANHSIACSAAPIFDHGGKLIGVLDVTGDSRSFQRNTLALVHMSAQMIENQLFSAASRDAIALHFHTRAELVGTLMEGIVSFTPDGRFVAANRAALSQLGLPLSALESHTFSSLFGAPLSALFDHHRATPSKLLTLPHDGGARIFARAELRLDARNLHEEAPEKTRQRSRAVSGLRSLNTGDARLAAAIEKATKVLGRDIPILVMGETGTGKDLFAQAIHADASPASAPFIAVNCASIPETLIESELFGYEDGAFTGARKSGSIGKILQANRGTLFLDEIGDMPLHLQARLLRTLQDRTVTPLGSNKSIPVDFSLICATNRNLRDLIAKGLFREDLYYRLNGLVVKLPPLRERTDIETLTRKLVANASDGSDYVLAPETMLLFRQYRWPGNIRQLANLLRTAIVMAAGGHEIRSEHLSDDFLEEVGLAPENQPAPLVEQVPAAGAKLGDVEISMIRRTLDAHGGNVSAAARVLGISRNTIYRKLQTRT